METDPQQHVLGRLRKVEGQVRGIQRMIEEGRDCESILTQILAVRTALDRAAAELVAAHVNECLEASSPTTARATIIRAVQLLSRGG